MGERLADDPCPSGGGIDLYHTRLSARRLLVAAAQARSGGASPAMKPGQLLRQRTPVQPPVYRNPVLDRDFPDPSVLHAPDGYYYAYATQYLCGERAENIPGARSKDLIHWEVLPDTLPVKPSWASRTQDFWAPHVVADGGQYYLYFSAALDGGEGMAIGVATATSPRGPFVDRGA